MKKTFLLLTSFIFLQACTNEQDFIENSISTESLDFYNKSAIENADQETKLAYKNYHLKKVASLLSASFPAVFEETQKRHNINENQTVFSVEEVLESINSDFRNSFSNDLQFSIDAFKNLEGESWQPIFEFSNTNVLIQRNSYNEEKPIFIFEDNEDNEDNENPNSYTTAYQENEAGILEPLDEDVNEEFIQNKDLILIRIDDIDIIDGGHAGGGGSGGGGSGGNNTTGLLKINKMNVKHHKESWINGASEVHIKAYKFNSLPTGGGDCGDFLTSSVNCYNYGGKEIKKWKRNKIGTEKTLNWFINSTWNSSGQSNDFVFYVIFEQDSWPAPLRGHTFIFPNGASRNIQYRSNQTSYHHALLHMNSNNPYGLPFARSYSYSDGGISYNLQ